MSDMPLENFPALPRRPEPPAIDEKALMQCVIDTSRIFGWRVAHFRSVPVKRGPRVVWQTPVQADGAGFPDLVLVRDRILWRELKVGKNTLSAEQADWIQALEAAGADVGVWTDAMWLSGEIEAELKWESRSEAA